MAASKSKRNVTNMPDEDKAFFMNAYKNNPKAKADMDKDMKIHGLTYEQYFGLSGAKKTQGKTSAKKSTGRK